MRLPPFADITKILFQMILKTEQPYHMRAVHLDWTYKQPQHLKKTVAPDLLNPKHSLINTPPLQNAGMIFLKLGKLAVVKKPSWGAGCRYYKILQPRVHTLHFAPTCSKCPSQGRIRRNTVCKLSARIKIRFPVQLLDKMQQTTAKMVVLRHPYHW